MTYFIFRGDPSLSPPPSDVASVTVPLASDDRSVVTIGAKMFSSSDVSIISRANQERLVGRRSYGRFGDVNRHEPSHSKTLNVPFDGTEIPDLVFANLDQYTQDAVADLVFRRVLIVTQNPDRTVAAAYVTPPTIRAL
jgi:hypothetical protein